MAHQSSYRIQEADVAGPGVTFTSVTVSLHMFAHGPMEMDAWWSYGKG